MDRLLETWRKLSAQRRIVLIGAGVATLVAVLALAQMAARPGMSLLYSGLDPATAGEIVGQLEQMQVASEVRGDAIYVASDARDRVRLSLARQGLPRQGQAGYELLDQISGFSATSEMFDAAYWRAKEGELARTLLAATGVSAARVHLAVPSRRPFARESAAPSASITITMAGGGLGREQARAMRYLVALAVPGLDPTQVAVIDSQAGMVLAPGEESAAQNAAAAAAEREAKLEAEIEQLLAARVGRDRARVTVSVEADRESERVVETVIEPESQVTVSSDTEEITREASGSPAAVTVASNLPTGEGAQGPKDKSSNTESRARVNYDYSTVRRERERAAGAIRQISVAVLVDGITAEGPDGQAQWEPRPEEELAALGELVRAAVGFDAERGDVVTVKSMRFQPDASIGTLAEANPVARFLERNALTLVQIGVLALVAIVLALTVVRPILAGRAGDPADLVAVNDPAGLPDPGAGAALESLPDGAAPGGAETQDRLTPTPDTLRRVVSEKQEQTLAMLTDWLSPVDTGSEGA